MMAIGIDPGRRGGIVRLNSLSNALTFYPLPLKENRWDPGLMAALVGRWMRDSVDAVAIESCHAFPGISAQANWMICEGYSMWRGALANLNVKLVHSMTWRKGLGIETVRGRSSEEARQERKFQSLERARLVFKLPFQTVKGRDLDGEAEASLIALWCVLDHHKGVEQCELKLQ